MVLCKILVLGIFIANAMLPVYTASHELPRSRPHPKKPLRSFLKPALIPFRDPYDDNNHFRKQGKIYILKLDPDSQLMKKLAKLALQSINDESRESSDTEDSSFEGLPAEKPLVMLPLVDFDGKNNDGNDLNLNERDRENEDANYEFGKLFNENGIVYLTKPKERKVKDHLRLNEPVTLEVLNKMIGNENEKRKKPAAAPKVYNFSDLVL